MRKIALITGGTSGIGLETSKRLVAQGYDLHLVYKSNHKKAAEAVVTLNEINPDSNIVTEAVDLSKKENCLNFTTSFSKKYAKDSLNAFISCHGHISPGLFLQKQIDSVLNVINEHLLSNLIITHSLLQKMCVQKYGRIVFITSLSAHKINQGQADYALSKAALEIFVKSLTSEYSQRNVTFNCICAGLVNTKILGSFAEEMIKSSPNSVVPVEQVGDMIELLVSEKSSHITGSTFLIDSGQSCRNNNLGYHKLSFHAKTRSP